VQIVGKEGRGEKEGSKHQAKYVSE
jgi:hypothetical protein